MRVGEIGPRESPESSPNPILEKRSTMEKSVKSNLSKGFNTFEKEISKIKAVGYCRHCKKGYLSCINNK